MHIAKKMKAGAVVYTHNGMAIENVVKSFVFSSLLKEKGRCLK